MSALRAETKTALVKRWSTGYLSRVEPALRKILLDGKAEFEETLDLRGVKIPDDKNHPRELWFTGVIEGCLDNIDFSFASLSINLPSTRMSRLVFNSAKFDRVVLNKSSFDHCSFEGAKLVTTMDDVVCTDCKFSKARWGATSTCNEYGGRRTTFVRCVFDEALFRRVEFRASSFLDCSFRSTRFQACDLRGAKFEGGSPLRHQFEDMCRIPDLDDGRPA